LNSRRFIDAEDLGLIFSKKQYYNLIQKKVSDKIKLYTIEALLLSLNDSGFIYKTQVSIEENKTKKIITHKLI
jgi:hypothetical protein